LFLSSHCGMGHCPVPLQNFVCLKFMCSYTKTWRALFWGVSHFVGLCSSKLGMMNVLYNRPQKGSTQDSLYLLKHMMLVSTLNKLWIIGLMNIKWYSEINKNIYRKLIYLYLYSELYSVLMYMKKQGNSVSQSVVHEVVLLHKSDSCQWKRYSSMLSLEKEYFLFQHFIIMSWDSVVCIVTGYRLGDQGTTLSRPAMGPTQLSIQWVLGLRRPGTWSWPFTSN
jgi:hypothetical protein